MKIIRFALVLITSLVVTFIPQAAIAAPTVDQTQNLTSVGNTGPSCMNVMGMMNAAVGSIFTAGLTGDLTSIEFPILQTTTTESLTVSVYVFANGSVSGAPIAAKTFTPSDLTPLANGGNLVVNFATPAAVLSGSTYAFVMKFQSCSSNAQLNVSEGFAPADKRLVFNQNSGPTWTMETLYGMNFSTFVEVPQVQNTPTPTPTQSSSPQLAVTSAKIGKDVALWSAFSLFLVVVGSGAVFGATSIRTKTSLRKSAVSSPQRKN